MPPSQFENAFHNRSGLGIDGTSMVHAPVVVHPETDSKKQSAKLYPQPESRYGNVPIIETVSQQIKATK